MLLHLEDHFDLHLMLILRGDGDCKLRSEEFYAHMWFLLGVTVPVVLEIYIDI